MGFDRHLFLIIEKLDLTGLTFFYRSMLLRSWTFFRFSREPNGVKDFG